MIMPMNRAMTEAPMICSPAAFSRFSNTFAILDGLVFDACAGPVSGKDPLRYYNDVVDKSTPEERKKAGNGTLILYNQMMRELE